MSTTSAGNRVGLPALWFGLFGAPAAWSVQLLVAYPLAAYACFPRTVPLEKPAFGGLLTVLLLISLVTLAVGGASFVVALRNWRAAGSTVQEARVRFMAFSGLLLSGIFVLGIVMHAATLLLLDPCW